MICQNSPKSSEFDKNIYTTSGQKSLTMFISLWCNNINWIFKNREIN